MRYTVLSVALLIAFCLPAAAQKSVKRLPAKPVIPSRVPIKQAEVARSFQSAKHGFSFELPDDWTPADASFERTVRARGIDLSLKAPGAVSPSDRTRMNSALTRVKVLYTAFRARANSREAAVLRVVAEDLAAVPQVKDAVDYFDLMRSQFAAMTLPRDFVYSETQAEKLGRRQFAFLDTSTGDTKKRLYATVKDRHAIMFTVTYRSDADLEAIRQMIAAGNFSLK